MTVKPHPDIEGLLVHYDLNRERAERFGNSLQDLLGDSRLRKHTHSLKYRLKERTHLHDKLRRRIRDLEEQMQPWDITPDNLFLTINDIIGLRILHLHTRQFARIHETLQLLFEEEEYVLHEAPFARTWDNETAGYFKALGLEVQDSESLYTSVHYVVRRASSQLAMTAEIQVRTLAEELWGEVDHAINYPHKCPDLACREQILVLARVTSSASRLADAIFATYSHYDATRNEAATRPSLDPALGPRGPGIAEPHTQSSTIESSSAADTPPSPGETTPDKVRVYDLARELNLSNKDLEALVRQLGIEIRNYMSTLSAEEAQHVRRALSK